MKSLDDLQNDLGRLAMKFRGCYHAKDRDEQRKVIAQEYERIVIELVESGVWNEIPAPEDQLTDEYMPEAFFKYWGLRWPR